MYTGTTSKPVNTEKMQRAIFVLETLSDANSKQVLETIKGHRSTTFFELMIYTGINSEELEVLLDKLCDTGAIIQEEVGWHSRFSVDEKRLSAFAACARALARGARF